MRTKQWRPIELSLWRGSDEGAQAAVARDYDADHVLIKEERMPDGTIKRILRQKSTGAVVHRASSGGTNDRPA
jgi:hypothetical protein